MTATLSGADTRFRLSGRGGRNMSPSEFPEARALAQNGSPSKNKNKTTAMTSSLLRACTLACATLLLACHDDSSQSPATHAPVANMPDYWPTAAWKEDAPEKHGFSSGALETLASDA